VNCNPLARREGNLLSYYQVNRAEIGGINIYVKHWLPECRKGIVKLPMIGISDGTNFIDFKNAEDLSDTIREINATPAIQPKGMSLPIEAIGEIIVALALLALKIQWVLTID
jgi:hypothetical protein